MIDLITV